MKKNILFMAILLGIVLCASYIIKRDKIMNSVARYDSGVSSLMFNEKKVVLKPNETIDVSKFLNIYDSSKIIYVVNDDEVATIDNKGLVKTKNIGTAIISAIDENGRSANMYLTVINDIKEEIMPLQIILNEKEKNLLIGQTYRINYELYPNSASDKKISYKSSNPDVASVNNGVISAKNIGRAIISICSMDVCSNLTINVKKISVGIRNINVYPSEITLNVNETASLNVSYIPNNSNQEIKWTSSDETIVKVENGKITGLKKGSTYVTATASGISSDCFVTVIEKNQPEVVKVTSITLNKNSVELEIGNTFQVVPTILPKNASDKKLNYTTSNKKIFTVSEKGLITGISSGTAYLNVCSINNICSKMQIVIKPKIVSAEKISLNLENTSLKISEEKQLKANILPSNTTNKSIIWISSNDKIVSVKNGLIKGVGAGKATITAITNNGLMAKSNIIVLPNNSVFKYGEELNGTNNYCLSGGITSNKKYNKSDINSELSKYMNDAYDYAKVIGDIDPLRAKVVAAAYFLGFNPYCRVRYMEGYEDASKTLGWWENWTSKTGIDSLTFIKWSYYQVYEKNYERYILGKYKKEINYDGLSVSDFIDVALPGDVLIKKEKYGEEEEFAMILSINTKKNEVTIIYSGDGGIRIEVINDEEPTDFTILTDMKRIFN